MSDVWIFLLGKGFFCTIGFSRHGAIIEESWERTFMYPLWIWETYVGGGNDTSSSFVWVFSLYSIGLIDNHKVYKTFIPNCSFILIVITSHSTK
jgi:hypothetical protein